MKLIKSLFVAWAILMPAAVYASPSSIQEACPCSEVCPMHGHCPSC